MTKLARIEKRRYQAWRRYNGGPISRVALEWFVIWTVARDRFEAAMEAFDHSLSVNKGRS